MNKLAAIILLFCLPLLSIAQMGSFRGIIVEEDNRAAIGNAVIAVQGTTLVAITDDDGSFNFNNDIPAGKHLVLITGDGFEDRMLRIDVSPNSVTEFNSSIGLELTKSEKKARKKSGKADEKELKQAEKLAKEEEKSRQKMQKKLDKENTGMEMTYTTIEPEVVEVITPEEPTISPSPVVEKYAVILAKSPEEITNDSLYEFIDEWMGTEYVWGGESKEGIDCSSFTQILYTKVYDHYIERTAEKQIQSTHIQRFRNQGSLKEGDLIFFKDISPDGYGQCNHVGVYLGNDMFINATEYKGDADYRGVKIDDLSEPYWQQRYLAAGRHRDISQ